MRLRLGAIRMPVIRHIVFHCTFTDISASPLCLYPKFCNTAEGFSLLLSINLCLKNSTGWRRTVRGPGPWWQNCPSYFPSQDGTLFHSPWRPSSFRNNYSLEHPWLWRCMPTDCTVSGRSFVLGSIWRPTPPQAWPSWRLFIWIIFQYLI